MNFKKMTFLLSFLFGFFLISASAFATTYNYVGPNYIAGQVSGPYTTSMRVTGTITTSSPIPPSSIILLSDPIVTSWSFNDGVQTLDNTNSSSLPPPYLQAFVFADATGAIAAAYIYVGQNPIPTVINGLNNQIFLAYNFPGLGAGGDGGFQDTPCTIVAGGVCTDYNLTMSHGRGATFNVVTGNPVPLIGRWSIQAENVPSLSTWGIIFLVLSLLFFSQKRMGLLQIQKSKK